MHHEQDALAITSAPPRQRAALAALVEEYQQPLGGYLLHLVGELELAVALTRETFVQASRTRPPHLSELAVRLWLYQLATRLAYDHFLRLRQTGPLSTPRGDWSAPDVAGGVTRPRRARVQSALRQLHFRERAVLLLCELEQFTHAQAAAILQVSRDVLERRLARARAHFRLAHAACAAQREVDDGA